ncbi:PE-PPE domain-containing protein [Nocardia rhizosphaerae]|uniref:PE-PPE domain-containing protein n=1 Tax=Nocardia rhizosphaerae TaxID=1691571 RepID=A0ABV8KZP9_9NOCA
MWSPKGQARPRHDARTIDVLVLGGTWNPGGDGVTTAFTDALNTSMFRPRMVPYPADYGTTMSFTESVAAGKRALLAAIDRTPNLVVLAGYSQGAAVAGDVAAAIGRGEHPGLEVLACALIADPCRPAGRYLGDTDPGGFGVVGERHIDGIPAYWAAAPGDPITALPAGNPLRTIADLSAFFSFASPSAAVRWAQRMLDTATRKQLQRWWSPANWREWAGAVAYARGYLFDGRHTDDYVRNGHARALAQALNRDVAEGRI